MAWGAGRSSSTATPAPFSAPGWAAWQTAKTAAPCQTPHLSIQLPEEITRQIPIKRFSFAKVVADKRLRRARRAAAERDSLMSCRLDSVTSGFTIFWIEWLLESIQTCYARLEFADVAPVRATSTGTNRCISP